MEHLPEHCILEFQPNTLEEVRKCFDLDQKMVADSIDILEDWIKKQDHLIKKDFSRHYLERTIGSCKGSVEKAKRQIDKLCTLKTLVPFFFSNFDINTNLKSISEKVYIVPFPKMTKEFQRVFLIKINTNKITPANFLDYFRMVVVVCEYLKAHDYVNGFININDYRMLNIMDLLTNLNLSELQQFMTILTEGYGARLVNLHVITTSRVVDGFIKTVKPFFKPKIADRIKFHSSVEDLHAFVDKSILPVDYGGDERSVDELRGIWNEELGSKKHLDRMRMMSAACTDESRRQTSLFNEEYLGMAGTFRSMNVD